MLAITPAARRWSQVIDRQEASGQSVRAFAVANNLNPHTLASWRCKLGRTLAGGPHRLRLWSCGCAKSRPHVSLRSPWC